MNSLGLSCIPRDLDRSRDPAVRAFLGGNRTVAERNFSLMNTRHETAKNMQIHVIDPVTGVTRYAGTYGPATLRIDGRNLSAHNGRESDPVSANYDFARLPWLSQAGGTYIKRAAPGHDDF